LINLIKYAAHRGPGGWAGDLPFGEAGPGGWGDRGRRGARAEPGAVEPEPAVPALDYAPVGSPAGV
jgi:hypothetical protein